jgi:hypothetical protein
VAHNVIFTAPANANGTFTFVYTAQDNGTTNGVADPRTDTATVTVVVREVNDPPVAGMLPGPRPKTPR